MKNPLKRKALSLFLLAGVVAGATYLYLNAGGMLVRTTEKIASDALGVSVDIGSIHLALADKKVTVRGIQIGNPPGFKHPQIITAKTVDIVLASFSKEEIDFKSITVQGSEVNLELNEHGLNVLALKDRMGRKEQKENATNEAMRVIIDRMIISPTKIHPSITAFGDPMADIHVPTLTLDGIGRGRSVTAGDAIVQIMDQYLSLVEKQASNTGILKHVPGTDEIKKGADDAVNSIRKLF